MTSDTTAPKTRTGSCLCRTIRYTATGEPKSFFVCHCINCRKATGAAFMANAIFRAKDVKVTQGQEHIRRFRDSETGSGAVLNRSFCGKCGSNILLGHDKAENIVVATGSFDEEPGWVPEKQIYTGGTRPWIEGIRELSKL